MADRNTTRSIGEVINDLRREFPELTVSKIRFLEGQGLVEPQRSPSGYRMFSNDVLMNLAALRPASESEFLAIKGLGPAKFAQFGREILELIEAPRDRGASA